MQLQNFECQIAKAQIGRFVAGDALSDEALAQLEAHISKCPECKQNLAERRALLQAMLSPSESRPQPKPEGRPDTQPAKPKFDLADFIKTNLQRKQPVTAAVQIENPKPTSFTKPAIYSVALGVVLIGMSYASRNMESLFGRKAIDAPAPEAQQAHPVRNEGAATAPAQTAIEGLKVGRPVGQALSAFGSSWAPTLPPAHKIAPAETPKRRNSAFSHSASEVQHPRPSSHETKNEIRVYGLEK